MHPLDQGKEITAVPGHARGYADFLAGEGNSRIFPRSSGATHFMLLR